jgi:hypothetical protein
MSISFLDQNTCWGGAKIGRASLGKEDTYVKCTLASNRAVEIVL